MKKNSTSLKWTIFGGIIFFLSGLLGEHTIQKSGKLLSPTKQIIIIRAYLIGGMFFILICVIKSRL